MTLVIAMVMFSFTMSVSPGPVNFIALTSGVNVGFWRSFPFVTGATLGFILMLFLVGLGFGSVMQEVPKVLQILKFLGCGMIVYMGINILRAGASEIKATENKSTPTFIHGFFLQWLNPKAWIACMAGCAAFDVAHSFENLLLFVSIYLGICWAGISSWAWLGDKVSVWLNTDGRMLVFNRVMGVILCLVGVYLLLPY